MLTVNDEPTARPLFRRIGLGAIGLIAGSVALHAGTAGAAESLEVWPDISLFGLLANLGLDSGGLGPMWVMVVLCTLLIFPMNALIYQPIFRALDARAERIQGARSRSEQLQSDADDVLARYEQAIREARAESEGARQTQLATARDEQASVTGAARAKAEAELERARGELARSLEEARGTLRTSAEELATAAAEQVLGRNLS